MYFKVVFTSYIIAKSIQDFFKYALYIRKTRSQTTVIKTGFFLTIRSAFSSVSYNFIRID